MRSAALVRLGVACTVLVSASAVAGCSSEDGGGDGDRRNVPVDGGGGGSADGAAPDPNGGRDESSASCFAACQNTSFTCQARGSAAVTKAEATLDGSGCSGTATAGGQPVALKLDCNARTVCLGSACSPGTFSAFSFSHTADGSAPTVCTRD